jgi:hypothetical protein
MSSRALNALAMDRNSGSSVQPMVVRVVVPSRKGNSELMNDAAVLLDPDVSTEEVLKSLRRMQALVKTPKFVQGGSKAANPIIKAVLGIIRARGGPLDELVLLTVLDTLAVLCKAVKGAAIMVRLENGLPNITSLIALHIKRTSVQKAGFACLSALAASPQNAIAIAKAGAVQAVLVVLNDRETKYFGVDSMEAATLGLQLLTALIKATDATLPLLGTQLIMQAVVNAIYARVGNRKVVMAATEVLFLIVKRHHSEDVSEAMMQRYIEKLRDAGGVDAMLVVIGRYSDCPDLFKLAYAVLNRLQRSVLTSEILGEFPEARAHLSKLTVEDSFNPQLLFPEQQEFTTDIRAFLDADHAASLPGRGVPEAISGARPMLKGAGVQASWSRNCNAGGKREPFLPPGPEVMAEVMLLNVARWLKTRPLHNRVVYNVHDRTAPCKTLFDCARHLAFKDAPLGLVRATPEPPSPTFQAPAVAQEQPVRTNSGEEAGAEEEREGDQLEWSVGALPLVERRRLSGGTPMSCRVQRDSDNDMSDNDDANDEEASADSEAEAGDQDALESALLDGEDMDAADLLNLLQGEDMASDSPLLVDDTSPASMSPPLDVEAAGGAARGGEAEDNDPGPGGFFAKLAAAMPPQDVPGLLDGQSGDGDEQRRDGGASGCSGGKDVAGAAGAEVSKVERERSGGVASGREGEAGSVADGAGVSEQTLLFESRFEGGNLARAVQVHELEYDLYLMPDINSKAAHNGGNTQWYYFAVSNMEAGLEYKFNIVNLVKPDSLYNVGMRPALYSITDAGKGMSWRRLFSVCLVDLHIHTCMLRT